MLVAGGFLLLAKGNSPSQADPGGLTRLAADGKHNQLTEAGKQQAYERLKTLMLGPPPKWVVDPNNMLRAIVTLVPKTAGSPSANESTVELLAKGPQGTTAWVDATYSEFAFTQSPNPPLDLLSAKFNLLTTQGQGWKK